MINNASSKKASSVFKVVIDSGCLFRTNACAHVSFRGTALKSHPLSVPKKISRLLSPEKRASIALRAISFATSFVVVRCASKLAVSASSASRDDRRSAILPKRASRKVVRVQVALFRLRRREHPFFSRETCGYSRAHRTPAFTQIYAMGKKKTTEEEVRKAVGFFASIRAHTKDGARLFRFFAFLPFRDHTCGVLWCTE